jgi:chromosome segregation ATPase
MEPEETEELLEEIEGLRRRVADLSEAIADCRARRLQQEGVIARLRAELDKRRRQEPHPGPSPAGEGAEG